MAMMSGMQDPSYREAIEGKLQNLKNDPELEKIMKEIETGGPAAMMKYALVVPASPHDLQRWHWNWQQMSVNDDSGSVSESMHMLMTYWRLLLAVHLLFRRQKSAMAAQVLERPRRTEEAWHCHG